MHTNEPTTTAVALLVAAILLVFATLLSRTSGRVGVPYSLVFLVIGMAAGSEGLGGIPFEDFQLAFRVGTVALVLILFDGGLNTPLPSIRAVAWPASVLATVGVAGVAVVAALGARLVGLTWPEALVFGAIVSSTDAASVFSVLRSSGIQLKQRVAATLEVESGINDPMAVILTFAFTRLLAEGTGPTWRMALDVVVQIVVGTALGWALGRAGSALVARVRLAAAGLYPVLTVALALLAFAVPTLFQGSGFLAVYVAAAILGNRPLRNAPGVRHVHDALAWVGQITMFLILGLLVFPSRVLAVWKEGLVVTAFLTFVARPVVVAACLAAFRYPPREILYAGWIGLRGAVPIILATFPVLAGAPGATRIFDIVFFAVVVNAFVPGATVGWLARRLGLESALRPAPRAVLEISSISPMNGDLASYYVRPESAAAGSAISDLPFAEGTRVVLVVRGTRLLAPAGNTILEPGDHVFVFSETPDRAMLQLVFGTPEED
jgi:cell volume regulation protein A